MKRGSPVVRTGASLDRVRSFDAATKPQCGYLIADTDEFRSFKAEPIGLMPDMLAIEAFQTVARGAGHSDADHRKREEHP